MTKRHLLSATAGFALLSSLLLGCTVQVPSDDKNQGAKKDDSSAAADTDGDTAAPTDGEDGDPAETTPGASADTSVFSNKHWSTPDGVGISFYDVEFSSDGTYRKQMITLSNGTALLKCEHGSWTAKGPGNLELTSTCSGSSYEQPWRQSSDGDLVLQNIEYSPEPSDVWNCAATECK